MTERRPPAILPRTSRPSRFGSSHREDYRSWDRPPGYEERSPGTGPHGDQIDLFVNDVVTSTLRDSSGLSQWPVGSLIVKDGYNDSEHIYVAVLEKGSTGWWWAEYYADGGVITSGQPAGCINCHSSGSDYVRALTLR
jgi:hypothetical protein